MTSNSSRGRLSSCHPRLVSCARRLYISSPKLRAHSCSFTDKVRTEYCMLCTVGRCRRKLTRTPSLLLYPLVKRVRNPTCPKPGLYPSQHRRQKSNLAHVVPVCESP